MAERFLAQPTEFRPAITAPLSKKKLQALQPLFEQGQTTVASLYPAILLAEKVTTEPGEMLLYDGNHRFTLGVVYNILVPAILFSIGETISTPDGYTHLVTPSLVKLTRGIEATIQRKGFPSFEALAKQARLL